MTARRDSEGEVFQQESSKQASLLCWMMWFAGFTTSGIHTLACLCEEMGKKELMK